MLEVKEILEATNGILINGKNGKIKKYAIDSRECDEFTFFIPLKGEKVNGHDYINGIEKLKGFFIDKNYNRKAEIVKKAIEKNKNIIIVEVEDTYKALIAIATCNSKKNNNMIKIAVTGSVGKTSTREMIASVLSIKYSVIKTIKNYNSEIGVSLMMLMTENQQVGIYEMGMDGIGQIEVSTKIVNPNYAVITNIGTAHIGILGSRENILKAKMEIADGLKSDGTLFINEDSDLLKDLEENNNYSIVKYGIKNNKNIKIIETSFNKTVFVYNNNEYVINEPGEHHVYNAIVAIEIANKIGMKYEDIKRGIENYRNYERRFKKEVIKNNITIIDDSYNASIDSFISGLNIISKLESDRKFLVLGDILELGEFSKQLHEELAKYIKKVKVHKIFLYGKEIEYTYKKLKFDNVCYFNNQIELQKQLLSELKENDVLYFKASNGMKLCNIIEYIKNEY